MLHRQVHASLALVRKLGVPHETSPVQVAGGKLASPRTICLQLHLREQPVWLFHVHRRVLDTPVLSSFGLDAKRHRLPKHNDCAGCRCVSEETPQWCPLRSVLRGRAEDRLRRPPADEHLWQKVQVPHQYICGHTCTGFTTNSRRKMVRERTPTSHTVCVILNWPEWIKTQPHDDGDNCFLHFDSKGPCGMTLNNDIDDDSATKHSDSHTRNSHRQSV